MALFNKLFSPRRKTYTKSQDNVCTRLFPFSKDQVRVVLFRECDFRGRKLLFDSHAIQKIPLGNENFSSLPPDISSNDLQSKNEKYAEVTNKFGYVYTKPNPDVGQLGEMIFGSVAMSYRGTSFKIHSLKSPSRIMCTQVFPSPRHTKRCRSSAPSSNYFNGAVTSTQSLEHSIPLYDSGTSSTTSISDHLSNQSNASDTLLVCKGPQSIPLDVPAVNSYTSSPSVIGDSGFSGEQSYSSVSSGPQSCNTWDLSLPSPNGTVSFSSNSLYKRWLRSANNSLEYSGSSSTGPTSADEFLLKPHQRTSKLGLAIIINLSSGEEENMIQFLMEHVVLIESLVWRARQGAEGAYIRSHSFVSLMFDIATCISQWLVDLLSGPQLNTNLWLVLSNNCDKVKSISIYSDNDEKQLTELRTSSLNNITVSKLYLNNSNSSSSFDINFKDEKMCNSCDLYVGGANKSDFTFLNITRLLKSEWEAVSGKKVYCTNKNFTAEKFITEFCELLETVDVKHTNFFISTLLTAVLTHHLGWVTTSLPLLDKETLPEIHFPSNPLWGQMTDLFGAVGYPTKIAHTVVTGTNKSDLISKLLNVLTYFIRCSDIKRNCLSRVDVNKENETVSSICQKNACIPKENYKKYEDHLKEMATINQSKKNLLMFKQEDNVKEFCSNENKEIPKKLTKTHTCCQGLSTFDDEIKNCLYPKLQSLCTDELDNIKNDPVYIKHQSIYPHEILDKVKNLNIQAVESFELTNDEITKKVNKLCRVPTNAVLYHLQTDPVQQLVDIRVASEEIKKVFSPKKISMEKQTRCSEFSFEKSDIDKLSSETSKEDKQNNVIFVLGDDEQLVGLKRDTSDEFSKCNNIKCSCDHIQENNNQNNLQNNKLSKNGLVRPRSLNFVKDKCKWSNDKINTELKDCYLSKICSEASLKPSTSWNGLNVTTNRAEVINVESELGAACSNDKSPYSGLEKEFNRSKSVPPTDSKVTHEYENKEVQSKYRYSGVKFNFQQYPQIFTNYLKSKNLTLSDKTLEFNQISAINDDFFDFTNYGGESEELEALQTPSNASELEFTSELIVEKQTKSKCEATEVTSKVTSASSGEEVSKLNLTKCGHVKKKTDSEQETELTSRKMKIITLPMPRSTVSEPLSSVPIGYTNSLMRGTTDHYISDMVLQGISAPKSEWEAALRSDLVLAARHPILDQPVDEAIAIIANTDTWEVQLMSSHTYVVDRGSSGVRVGMSQLVANMLESLLHMWRLRASPEYCLMHIEQRLQEFCVRSKALAQLLLATEFCSMDLLTSTLQLEVNDVPLLLAIASTHSPQVTQKYGLSFQ